MNAASWILTIIIAIILVVDVLYILKTGVSQCSGDCASGCKSHCHYVSDLKKARRKIAFYRKLRQVFHLS